MTSKIQSAIDDCLNDEEAIHLAEGLDDAFVGIARQFNVPFAVYNRLKCIAILEEEMGSWEDAEEYFGYNIASSYVGGGTPAFIEFPEDSSE
jgi:hypothetical protein